MTQTAPHRNNVSITLPAVQTDNQQILRDACDGDEKCVCISNAIFKHDSSWATAGVGKKVRNPCNMRPPSTWSPSVPFTVYQAPGNGTFAKFASLSDGITACTELYKKFYAKLPADRLVSLWTDGGGDTHYRSAVRNCF